MQGRLAPEELDTVCPDWREREAFVCGPGGLLQALGDRWRADGDPARAPETLYYETDGILYGRRQPGRVRPGNCCLTVAAPYTRTPD